MTKTVMLTAENQKRIAWLITTTTGETMTASAAVNHILQQYFDEHRLDGFVDDTDADADDDADAEPLYATDEGEPYAGERERYDREEAEYRAYLRRTAGRNPENA